LMRAAFSVLFPDRRRDPSHPCIPYPHTHAHCKKQHFQCRSRINVSIERNDFQKKECFMKPKTPNGSSRDFLQRSSPSPFLLHIQSASNYFPSFHACLFTVRSIGYGQELGGIHRTGPTSILYLPHTHNRIFQCRRNDVST
jgi:hypothetical protein